MGSAGFTYQKCTCIYPHEIKILSLFFLSYCPLEKSVNYFKGCVIKKVHDQNFILFSPI